MTDWRADVVRLRERRPRGWLFLCVANSARSQMAEGIARRLAPAGVEVWSAGSSPGFLNPQAVAVMAEVGIDLVGHHSKGLEAVPASRVDAVVTLCADEVCPAWWTDVVRIHWGLADPAAAPETQRVEAFRSVRDELLLRLSAVFAEPAAGGSPPGVLG